MSPLVNPRPMPDERRNDRFAGELILAGRLDRLPPAIYYNQSEP